MQNFFFALQISAYLILHKGVISLALARLSSYTEFNKYIKHMKLIISTVSAVLML